MKSHIVFGFLSALLLSLSCTKEQSPFWDTEQDITATIMQNKIYDSWSLSQGLFYGIKEDNKPYVHTMFNTIAGFDSLYIEGFQYRVLLKEVCRTYRRIEDAIMDTHGCELSLIEIISKSEVAEEFIVLNPYE